MKYLKRSKRWYVALAFLAAAAVALAHTPAHRHEFKDAEKWARVFDDPARDAWQKPQEVIAALAPAPDALVADIGAGTGYFAVRLAKALPRGKVYAADLEPDMVRHLARRAAEEGLKNLVAVQSSFGDARLPEQVDLALVVDVYHHIDDPIAYFYGLRNALKPGARVAIVDFRPQAPMGPPRRARIAAEKVKAQMDAAGYALAAEHGFLPHQYFLVFSRR